MGKSKNQLMELAVAQFIGFKHGKWDRDIIALVESMGLTKREWEQIKIDEITIIDERDMAEVDEYFKSK